MENKISNDNLFASFWKKIFLLVVISILSGLSTAFLTQSLAQGFITYLLVSFVSLCLIFGWYYVSMDKYPEPPSDIE